MSLYRPTAPAAAPSSAPSPCGAAAFTTRGAFAEELIRTPAQTEGPFYPDKLPLDTDNDLIIINDAITPAVGEVTHLSGRILDAKGDPVRNALVEIWQVDGKGVLPPHRSDSKQRQARHELPGLRPLPHRLDRRVLLPHDQARPLPRPHARTSTSRSSKGGKELLTTQCYVKGDPGNDRDGIYRGIRDPKARESVTVDFAPIKDSKIGELAAKFDIVLGLTPEA